jgi:anti-sigma B factor antagonist
MTRALRQVTNNTAGRRPHHRPGGSPAGTRHVKDGLVGLRAQSDRAVPARGEISVLSTATRTVVTLGGEIDIDLTRELVGACDIAMHMGLPVDFDVRDVTHMDSSAIAMIARVAYASTTPPRLIRPPDVVEFLLEVTGIGEVVEVTHADPDVSAHLEPAP